MRTEYLLAQLIVPTMEAAILASLLGYPKISVIEFGCGGGNGLLNAEMHINEVMKIFAVDIELYGFDCGSGLPSPRDYRDMPHYFGLACTKWIAILWFENLNVPSS
jgi:hypothetical protein